MNLRLSGEELMEFDIDSIQEMILEDAREVYTETVIDHAMNPRNVGKLPDPDGYGRITGSCGDSMEVWLKIENSRITDVRFMTDGCGTSIASGSMMTEMAAGKPIAEAEKIGPGEILDKLGGLPDESRHCALLAASTLGAAVYDYTKKAK